MRKFLSFLLITIQLFLLAGCWGSKKIEGQTYVTGIGLDFQNGQYQMYIQGLNFGNIAKQEGASTSQPAPPNLIGEARGKSIMSAYSILQQNAALPLYLGHVHVIILSKNILKEKMNSVIQLIGQEPLLRYNTLLMGTDDNIKDLLTSESFFNFSQLYSIIQRPTPFREENYTIPILKYNQYISRYYQPVGSILIPSMKINKEMYSEKKQKKLPSISGAFIFSDQHYKGWLNTKDLVGFKWFSKKFPMTSLSLYKEKVTVIIEKPKTKVVVLKGKNPTYKITVKANALVTQNDEGISVSKMEEGLNNKIRNEILTTIRKSDEIKTDLLNISEKSYRYYLKDWDLNQIKAFNEKSIKDIKVIVQIGQSQNYKR